MSSATGTHSEDKEDLVTTISRIFQTNLDFLDRSSSNRSTDKKKNKTKTEAKGIGGMFRRLKKDGQPPRMTESTPLTVSSGKKDDDDNDEADTFDVEEMGRVNEMQTQSQVVIKPNHSSSNPSTESHRTRNWSKLKEHVASGDVLLQSSLVVGGPPSHPGDSSLDGPHDRQSRREMAQERIRSKMNFTLTHCLMAIFCFIAIAVIAFSFVFDEQWTVIDSVYYAVVIFSSTGYGDLVPNSRAARAFTAVFTLTSIACLGVALGVLGNELVEAQQSAVERAKKLSEHHVVTLFSPTPTPDDEVTPPTAVAMSPSQHIKKARAVPSDPVITKVKEDAPSTKPAWVNVAQEFLVVVCVLVFFAFVIMLLDPAINLGNVGYFLIITSTTTGLGDVTPVSQAGRLVTAMLIPLAVGAMGRWLSITASVIIETRQRHFRRTLEAKDLTFEDLEVMDEDGDGNVTRAEFLEFMLVAMDKVDRGLIDELRQQFANLDTDGTGYLSRKDLIAMARKKLHDPVRKLELARYKEHLMKQGRAGQPPPQQRRPQRPSSVFAALHLPKVHC